MQLFKSWLNIGVNVAKSLIDGQAVEAWERKPIVLLDGQHWGLVLVDADGHHAALIQGVGGEKLDTAVEIRLLCKGRTGQHQQRQGEDYLQSSFHRIIFV